MLNTSTCLQLQIVSEDMGIFIAKVASIVIDNCPVVMMQRAHPESHLYSSWAYVHSLKPKSLPSTTTVSLMFHRKPD